MDGQRSLRSSVATRVRIGILIPWNMYPGGGSVLDVQETIAFRLSATMCPRSHRACSNLGAPFNSPPKHR